MPLSGCSTCTGLVVTAVVTILLFPAQYYVPDLYVGPTEPSPEPKLLRVPVSANATYTWLPLDLPPVDLFLTVLLILLAMVTYVCDWIQRKLMERRILKLNQCLQDCIERLRSWDVRQEQLEATLKMVQNATSEYNLLLYLLLRQHRLGPIARKPVSHCIFDKELDDLNFVTNPIDNQETF
ncbi:uncharacterized protein LOC123661539 [Melitaea cinxia]|uniref:uncharacterized protein LOC123661539 n=1 Tax=Melitaea cinxia TaxID=113334 RepID=UPI001E274D32|nr:uncharacterized protein LOC123661539 [Melitaea cinxia]